MSHCHSDETRTMNIPTDTTAITKCNEIATFLRWSRRWAWHAIPKWKFGFVGHRTSMASTADCSGYKIHTYVSYSLAYLKYLNKYALTTNVSAYVNTFVCQNYLCKIVLLCLSISTCQKRICGAQLSYVNMQMYWHILHMQNICGQRIFI